MVSVAGAVAGANAAIRASRYRKQLEEEEKERKKREEEKETEEERRRKREESDKYWKAYAAREEQIREINAKREEKEKNDRKTKIALRRLQARAEQRNKKNPLSRQEFIADFENGNLAETEVLPDIEIMTRDGCSFQTFYYGKAVLEEGKLQGFNMHEFTLRFREDGYCYDELNKIKKETVINYDSEDVFLSVDQFLDLKKFADEHKYVIDYIPDKDVIDYDYEWNFYEKWRTERREKRNKISGYEGIVKYPFEDANRCDIRNIFNNVKSDSKIGDIVSVLKSVTPNCSSLIRIPPELPNSSPMPAKVLTETPNNLELANIRQRAAKMADRVTKKMGLENAVKKVTGGKKIEEIKINAKVKTLERTISDVVLGKTR